MRIYRKTVPTINRKGFTIVELMIATVVFSVLLLLITSIIISLGNLYSKGVNKVRVQDDTRSIVDEITKNIQYGGQLLPGTTKTYHELPIGIDVNVYSYCIDSVRYTYVQNIQIGHTIEDPTNVPKGSDVFQHILWRDTRLDQNSCAPADLLSTNPSLTTNGTDGNELVPSNSRLSQFAITSSSTSPSVYTLTVGIAYGDNDLLNGYNTSNPTCKGQAGDTFCSTTYLQTTVLQRVSFTKS